MDWLALVIVTQAIIVIGLLIGVGILLTTNEVARRAHTKAAEKAAAALLDAGFKQVEEQVTRDKTRDPVDVANELIAEKKP